ncbi:alkaline phosphatase family protein [Candidatus Babeliales bacterium]|nr:alkaline phosphatase family protein [Candidatus Babeliales bacterium]
MIKKIAKSLAAIFVISILLAYVRPSSELGTKGEVKVAKPKIVLVFVVDQFAHHYLAMLRPYLNFGLKKLVEDGINFERANHPHGAPATATGHATLSTGTCAKDHGYILNAWADGNGKKIRATQDDAQTAAVLGRNGPMNYGASPKLLMVDTLSDQLVAQSTPEHKNTVFSLSFKTRAAIAMAGKGGHAIWFNDDENMFTSSKAYYQEIPEWVQDFNKRNDVAKIKEIDWQLFHPENHEIYEQFANKDYRFAGTTLRLAGNKTALNFGQREKAGKYDDQQLFQRTPMANGMLADLTKECIDKHFEKDGSETLFVWVGFSALDKIGHVFGPNSLEMIDTICHLDKQIEDLMNYAQNKAGAHNALFAVSGDHGVSPIPELMHERGFGFVSRLLNKDLTNGMNNLIEEKYGISGIVKTFKTTMFYLNKQALAKVDQEKQNAIIEDLRNYLQAQPGMCKVFTTKELVESTFDPTSFEYLYQNQTYVGRTGDLICMPNMYSFIAKRANGTSHKTPYDYDTHVPLILYQAGSLEKKRIIEKVSTTQLAPTLAKILQINKPSAAAQQVLPGIFEEEGN